MITSDHLISQIHQLSPNKYSCAVCVKVYYFLSISLEELGDSSDSGSDYEATLKNTKRKKGAAPSHQVISSWNNLLSSRGHNENWILLNILWYLTMWLSLIIIGKAQFDYINWLWVPCWAAPFVSLSSRATQEAQA